MEKKSRLHYKKQAKKYLAKCDTKTYDLIMSALEKLEEDFSGDIKRLEGKDDEYRLSRPPYRIIFRVISGDPNIYILKIFPRGDVYKKG